MKKKIIFFSIVGLILSGCSTDMDIERDMKLAPKSVADMIQDKQLVGWQDYKSDNDKDGVLDYKDKCLNTPKGAKVNEFGCAMDTDKDGVFNGLDKCPNTPDGIKVNKFGCAIDSDKDGINDIDDKCPNTPEGAKVDKFGCVIDNDGDGVPDYKDKCLSTPEDIKVNEFGCAIDKDKDGVPDYKDKCLNTPKGVRVNEFGCAIDSDKDRIPNYQDKCPNTPKGVKVDKFGCAIDSDKDGVVDYKDKCPNTPKNMKVNFQGCPILAEYKFNFKYNSFVIEKKYFSKIRKLAKILQNNKFIKIEIQGYTDNKGKSSYNKKLSLRRANFLKNILIYRFKISPDRILVKGFGSSHPIADNSTKEGRAKNRRIVVIQIKE